LFCSNIKENEKQHKIKSSKFLTITKTIIIINTLTALFPIYVGNDFKRRISSQNRTTKNAIAAKNEVPYKRAKPFVFFTYINCIIFLGQYAERQSG